MGVTREGSIIQCYAEGDVNGIDYVGGLIGYNFESDVSDSYALGAVSGNEGVGGLIGRISNHHRSADVINCYAEGNVQGNIMVGGLVGFVDRGTEVNIYIVRCFALGNVTGNTQVGGLVGHTYDHYLGIIISTCYSMGDVNLTSDYGGGLIGESKSTVSTCYARGDVIGTDVSQYIGGLIGYDIEGDIKYSYATGNVIGSIANTGGLVGDQYNGDIDNCFWDITTGGFDNGYGTPKTTAEMQLENTFTDWPFRATWAICEGTNYPKFAWQIPAGDLVCPDGITFVDFSFLASSWLSTAGEINWNPLCDISDPKDDIIDELDLAVFCENWLAEVTP